jgi:polyketide biosynthesis enoyl-CoA hydratase PksI
MNATPSYVREPVVHLSLAHEKIAVVRMEDRASRNCASACFIEDLNAAFKAIGSNSTVSIVVIHGYENYFCCGGTREELLFLAEGKAQFTHFDFYDIFLRCELPVIAALQGHAIGAGLAFASYADIMILAEESVYTANFLQYGFTPGVGATSIIPKKFGATLGWEMMMTARNYFGRELRGRGAPVMVLPRAEVIAAAMSIASEMVEIPVMALKELKQMYVQSIRAEVNAAIQRELGAHERIFSSGTTRERIESIYKPL